MNKPGTLITSAVLAFGLAAGAMAADMPKTATATPVAADAASTPSTDTAKPAKKAKKAKKSKKAAATPTTTK